MCLSSPLNIFSCFLLSVKNFLYISLCGVVCGGEGDGDRLNRTNALTYILSLTLYYTNTRLMRDFLAEVASFIMLTRHTSTIVFFSFSFVVIVVTALFSQIRWRVQIKSTKVHCNIHCNILLDSVCVDRNIIMSNHFYHKQQKQEKLPPEVLLVFISLSLSSSAADKMVFLL